MTIQLDTTAAISLPEFPETRLLREGDIEKLCNRDSEAIINQYREREARPGETWLTFLPCYKMVSWQHSRAAFISHKANGRSPEFKGAICDRQDLWTYWFHDFREGCLAIQRLVTSNRRSDGGSPSEEEQVEALENLLLNGMKEAQSWRLSKVVVWSPNEQIESAVCRLRARLGVKVTTEELRKDHIPSIRWRGTPPASKVFVEPNEFYAWS